MVNSMNRLYTIDGRGRGVKKQAKGICFPADVYSIIVPEVEETVKTKLDALARLPFGVRRVYCERAAAGTNRPIIGITEEIPEGRRQGNVLALAEVIDEG